MSKEETITIDEIPKKAPRTSTNLKLKGGSPKQQTRRSKSMFQVEHKKYTTFAEQLKAGSVKALKAKTHIGQMNKNYFTLVDKLIAQQKKGRVSAIVSAKLLDDDMYMAIETEGLVIKAYKAKRIIDQIIVTLRKCLGYAEYIKLSWKHAKIKY